MSDTTEKLEDNVIWQEACSIAEHMYSKLHEFTGEEKWGAESKLRASSLELMFFVSQAIGSSKSPVGAELEWNFARKHLFGLKTIYRFAGKQGFIELDPHIMVRLNELTKLIDVEITKAHKKTEDHNEAEYELWQKKYKIWEKIKDEN
jgi:hypothetical protein